MLLWTFSGGQLYNTKSIMYAGKIIVTIATSKMHNRAFHFSPSQN